MPARRSSFRQVDVTRALRAAHAAGIEDVRVELEPDGRMVIVTGRAATAAVKANSIDDIMGARR